jgi:hypothetical protein
MPLESSIWFRYVDFKLEFITELYVVMWKIIRW